MKDKTKKVVKELAESVEELQKMLEKEKDRSSSKARAIRRKIRKLKKFGEKSCKCDGKEEKKSKPVNEKRKIVQKVTKEVEEDEDDL